MNHLTTHPIEPSDQVLEELAHTGEASDQSPQLLKLEANRITSWKKLPPMEFMLRLFNEPCFPRREIVAVTGRAKSGKTFIMSMLMTCCVVRQVLSFQRESPKPLRVLWYDTEQSDNSTQDILKNRIIPLYQQLAGDGSEFPEHLFDIFNVRNIDRSERGPLFHTALKHYHPDLVILDGLRDLVSDINDVVAAQDIMEEMMKAAQNNKCCIVCVLHQNKGGDSRDPRGHLGTELLNKAYDVFATEKIMPQKVFKLEQLYTRKYDIEQSLYFSVDDNGLPFITEAPPMPSYLAQSGLDGEERPSLNDDYVIHHANGTWEIDVPRLFTDAFQGYETLTGAALRHAVMTLGQIATRSLYNNSLDKAMKMSLMLKSSDSKNRVVYRLNLPDASASKPAVRQQSLWQDDAQCY